MHLREPNIAGGPPPAGAAYVLHQHPGLHPGDGDSHRIGYRQLRPGVYRLFLQQWAEAASRQTGIGRAEALRLGAEMLHGTGKLLTEGGFTPEQLQRRVAVPGGVTAEGIAVLQSGLEHVFTGLIETTHRKYDEDLGKLNHLFGLQPVPGADAVEPD